MKGGLIMLSEKIIVTVNCRNRICGKVDVELTKKDDVFLGLCPICGVTILSIKMKKEEEEE